MVFGQCEVEQRVRRLIFNSAPTALSWAHTWTKAFFPVHLLREAGSSSQLSAILPGRARPRLGGLGGVGCGRERETGGESRQTWGRALPAVPEQPGPPGRAGGQHPRGRPSRPAPPGRTPRPQRRGVAGSTGHGCSRRGGKALRPGRGFPVPPALSAADTPSGNENLGLAVSFSFAQGGSL